jgi:hypothetical protein
MAGKKRSRHQMNLMNLACQPTEGFLLSNFSNADDLRFNVTSFFWLNSGDRVGARHGYFFIKTGTLIFKMASLRLEPASRHPKIKIESRYHLPTHVLA